MPALSGHDEVRLAQAIERGDAAARDEMVVRNLGLVHSLAARHLGRGVAFDDLVQEGTIGLMRAIDKFDPSRGNKFSTYAVWWIRSALLDAIGAAPAIRIPRTARRQPATTPLRVIPRVSASLDQPVGDGLTPLADLIADDRDADIPQQAEDSETRRQLWSALRLLPERHRQVLVRRYGLVGDHVQSHKQIATSLGVGEERSRQLEHDALHRLRSLADRVPLAA
jgi:RNA polymerase sigma factor (sigma-70 family)